MKTKSFIFSMLIAAFSTTNAQSWQIIGDQADMSGSINSIAISQISNKIYSGGYLKYGALEANQVFMWDFTEWTPIGNLGIATGGVGKLVLDDSEKIYTIGDYKDSAGKYYIRFWNGTAWSALGNLKSTLPFTDIASDGQNIYVAGTFVNTNNGETCYLNKWDGTSWALVTASNYNGIIKSIAIDSQKNVIVAGDIKNALNQYGVFKISNGVSTEIGKLRSLSSIESIFVNKANDRIIAENGGRYDYNPATNLWTQLTNNSGFITMDYEEGGNYIVKYPNTNMYSQLYSNNISSTNSLFLGTGLFARDCKYDKFGFAVCGSGGKILRWSQKIGGLSTDENKKTKLSIYPNPTQGEINLESISKIVECEIYDISGKLIKTESSNSNRVKLNLSNLPKGNYTIKVNTISGTSKEKIILR